LLDAASSSYTITAQDGAVSTDVNSVATVSSYVPEYNAQKGIYFRIVDPRNLLATDRITFDAGDIPAAKLFGLTGRRRVGEIIEDKFLEEAVVVMPLIGEEGCKQEPIPLDEAVLFSRLAYLQKIGQLRFKYFTEEHLGDLALEDTNDFDYIDDLILAMEKFVFPPELDFLLAIRMASKNNKLTIRGGEVFTGSDSLAPYFAIVFNFSKKLTRNDRFALWQGHLSDSLSTSEAVKQTISVPIEKVFGKDFKFEDKIVRAMTFKAKFRGETNFDVHSSKRIGIEYDKSLDYDLSYNWPYDHCTILPLSKISAKVYCKED